jgi:hypothetical protein
MEGEKVVYSWYIEIPIVVGQRVKCPIELTSLTNNVPDHVTVTAK